MNTFIRFGWLAPVLALGFGLRAMAQDAPATTGKVLILANDRVIEGEIDRVGDQFRIRRGMGEALITADRAKRLCADWADALAYLRSQANLGDPDERLRLARWCHQHGLKDDALAETRSALEMRPTHPETKQLLHVLQRASASAPPAPVAVKTAALLPQLDLSADAVTTFNNRVQPILMNACARCHVSDPGSRFRLQRAGEIGVRTTTQFNLASAVAQLKLDNPAASPLLVKAVSAHGAMSQPPFRDRKSVPMQTLLHWAEQVAANNPHLRGDSAPTVAVSRPAPAFAISQPQPSGLAPPVKPAVSYTTVRMDGPDAAAFVNAQTALIAQKSPLKAPAATGARDVPGVVVNPNDPFDPAGFNRPAAAAK